YGVCGSVWSCVPRKSALTSTGSHSSARCLGRRVFLASYTNSSVHMARKRSSACSTTLPPVRKTRQWRLLPRDRERRRRNRVTVRVQPARRHSPHRSQICHLKRRQNFILCTMCPTTHCGRLPVHGGYCSSWRMERTFILRSGRSRSTTDHTSSAST